MFFITFVVEISHPSSFRQEFVFEFCWNNLKILSVNNSCRQWYMWQFILLLTVIFNERWVFSWITFRHSLSSIISVVELREAEEHLKLFENKQVHSVYCAIKNCSGWKRCAFLRYQKKNKLNYFNIKAAISRASALRRRIALSAE